MDGLVKYLGKNDFKYWSQEFDSDILDLVKQKELCSYEYLSGLEKFTGHHLSTPALSWDAIVNMNKVSGRTYFRC